MLRDRLRHRLLAGPFPGLLLLAGLAPVPTSAQESPGPRWGHVLVGDPADGSVLLFGGRRASDEPFLADTWTWDGASWRRHEVEGPAARGFAAAALHPARGTIVLHGGRAEGTRPHADTWEWNGSEWTPLETERTFAADHHALVHVPDTEELLAFGGWNGSAVSGDTWLLGETWRRHEGPGPPPRAAFGLGADAARGVVVLLGGLWIHGQYADAWEWDSSGWRAATGPYDNSSLDHHALLWHPPSGRLLGFGGKNYRYEALDRLFVVEAGRPRVLAAGGPRARHSTPLAWNGARVFVYGGKEYEGRETVSLGDFWAWDGTAWRLLAD